MKLGRCVVGTEIQVQFEGQFAQFGTTTVSEQSNPTAVLGR